MERRAFLNRSALFTGLLATGALGPARVLAQGTDIPERSVGTPTLSPLHRVAELGNARAIPGALLHFLMRGQDTGGSFSLLEARARPGMEPPPHVHSREDESFYMLAGRMWFRIGDTELEAGPGDFVFMPRHIRHQMKILSEEIHVLILISPAGFEDYFWRLSAPAESLEIPPLATEPPTPEQMELFARTFEEFGLSC